MRATYLDYKEGSHGDLIVRVAGRDEHGERRIRYIKGTRPYLFVPEDEPVPDEPRILSEEDGYESFDGKPLTKIELEHPQDTRDIRGDFSESYESDIPYYRRKALDGLIGHMDVPPMGGKRDISEIDTDPDFEEGIEPRIAIGDIEVAPGEGGLSIEQMKEEATQPVIAVTLWDSYDNEYWVIALDPDHEIEFTAVKHYLDQHWPEEYADDYVHPDFIYKRCSSEKAVWHSIADFFTEKKPDVVGGWNWVDFDWEYLLGWADNIVGQDKHYISDLGSVSGYETERVVDGLPAFDMMDAFCFSGDTDVLTPDGVRNIKELEEGDTVYTLNEDTHEVEEKPVVETHETRNKWGTLESHTGRSHDFKVTPNHRFYVSNDARTVRDELTPDDYSYHEYRDLSEEQRPYKFPEHTPGDGEKRETFDLAVETGCPVAVYSNDHGKNLRDRLDATANERVEIAHGTDERVVPDGEKVRKYLMPFDVYTDYRDAVDTFAESVTLKADRRVTPLPKEYNMDRWLSLMGWYLSEGYTRTDSDALCICQELEDHRETLRRLLDEMELPYNEKDREFEIPGQVVGQWFAENCGTGAESKRVPEWVFDLHPDHLVHLLDALVDGDGTRNSDTSLGYSTVSDELKEDVIRLGLLCGWKPRVRQHSTHTHIHEVYLSRQGGSFKKADGDSIDHDGMVYCITAKDNHTIMAGRGGKFSWIGQCEKMTWTNWRSRSLDYVAEEELNVGKVDNIDIGETYAENPSRLLAYNIIDTQLCVALERKHEIFDFFFNLGDLSSIPIYDTFSELRLVDGYIMSRRDDDEVLPEATDKDLVENAGALVLDPTEGIEDWVGTFDVKSLYPSAIITCNISPETMGGDDVVIPAMPEHADDVGGTIDKSDIDWQNPMVTFGLEQEGIIPRYIKQIFERRDRFKDLRDRHEPGSVEYEKYDTRQYAVKVIQNSFYGVASSPYWRLAIDGLGDAVTGAGRYVLWSGARMMREVGYDILTGDTDSVITSLQHEDDDGLGMDDYLLRGSGIETQLNDRMATVASDMGITEQHPFLKDGNLHGTDQQCFVWEFEKLYRRFLMSGSKKRYAGSIVWKEGKETDDTDITGFESRRSDVPEVVAETQKEIIELVLEGEDFETVSETVQRYIEDLKENFDPKRHALPGTINQEIEEYPNRPVKRAVQYSNEHLSYDFRVGGEPWLIPVRETPPHRPPTDYIAIEWTDDVPDGFTVDYNKLVEKCYQQPLEPILEVVGWTWREVKTGRRTQSLDGGSSTANPFSDEDTDEDDSGGIHSW